MNWLYKMEKRKAVYGMVMKFHEYKLHCWHYSTQFMRWMFNECVT